MTEIWAHRGASSQAPENTMPAFELAMRQGADGIELDVMRTADGIIVVTHDEFCHRLTGSQGMIGQKSFSELRKLDFAANFPEYSPQRLPALPEVLDLIRPSGIKLNIELKNGHYFDEGLEEAVLDELSKWQLAERIVLSSFNHYSMQRAAQIVSRTGSGIKCGLLYNSCLVEPWQYARALRVQAIHPLYANLQLPGFVENCHAAGIEVNAWTIDNPDHIGMAINLGVDAVITNVPARAMEIRSQLWEKQQNTDN